MEESSDDSDIPIPLNSTITSYGHGGQMIHHANPAAAAGVGVTASNHHRVVMPQHLNGVVVHTSFGDQYHITSPYTKKQQQKPAKYKECLKNHAAAIGGSATDGCGEFMPSGEEATIEAFTCSACHCHRNFHRKQVQEDNDHLNVVGRSVVVFGGHHKSKLLGYPTTVMPAPQRMIMSYNVGGGLGDEQEGGGGVVGAEQTRKNHTRLLGKRFRTKFTHEQKEKMLNLAEKVGWKIQKQHEGVVQQLCQEIGVKRRVFKVWMHNNKHNIAKKTAHL